jgi:protease-4
MWRFIRGLFAIIGCLCVILVLLGGAGAYLAYRHWQAPVALPGSVVLKLDLRQPLKETPPAGLSGLVGSGATVSDAILALDRAAGDPRVKGLFTLLDETEQGLAVTQELRDAIIRFRQSGKFALAWADTFGELSPGNQGYYLASAFDEIDMMPSGTLGLTGMAVQALNAKSLLDKLGVIMTVTKREEFKSAFETFTDDHPSEANLLQLKAILNDSESQLVTGIAQGRKLGIDIARGLIANGPYTAAEAKEGGLVDNLLYADEMLNVVRTRAPDAAFIDLDRYAASEEDLPPATPHVALIRASGLIVRGEDDSLGRIAADRVAGAFATATADPAIKAVVLRVDSPGGSPVASDTIARQVRLAMASGKPVIVSMGNVAASGGYWLSMGATRIVAQPGTLTGSIGVIAGKPVIDGLMTQAGVLATTLASEENGARWSMTMPYTPAMQRRVDAIMDATYGSFKAGVADGRKLSAAKVEDAAKGRVWTGQSALSQGLVDRLGGLHEALDDARMALGLPRDARLGITLLPAPKTPLEQLRDLTRNNLGLVGSIEGMVAMAQRVLATNAMPAITVR